MPVEVIVSGISLPLVVIALITGKRTKICRTAFPKESSKAIHKFTITTIYDRSDLNIYS